ncbi:hypothetical protein C8Q80DRAFT_1291394 [Daedaleopsis nitida]|nr:hypothetical protein C8Q80DRAFT_1291394 [Daedaleopsis nitida]
MTILLLLLLLLHSAHGSRLQADHPTSKHVPFKVVVPHAAQPVQAAPVKSPHHSLGFGLGRRVVASRRGGPHQLHVLQDFEEMKASRQISEEEGKKVKDGSIVVVEAQKRISNEIFTRKNPSSEVSFFAVGLERKALEVVTREALGLLRPLIRQDIEKYFADIGLEAEFVSHNSMPNLCGGQKIKVVLGAANAHRPHLICAMM